MITRSKTNEDCMMRDIVLYDDIDVRLLIYLMVKDFTYFSVHDDKRDK